MTTLADITRIVSRDLEEQLLDVRMVKWVIAGVVLTILLLFVVIIMLFKLLMRKNVPVVIQQQATKVCMNYSCACIHIAITLQKCVHNAARRPGACAEAVRAKFWAKNLSGINFPIVLSRIWTYPDGAQHLRHGAPRRRALNVLI